jgi:hypothetical protein
MGNKGKGKQYHYSPRGFQEFEAPRYRDNRQMKVVSLAAQRTSRLYPRKIFLLHIMSMKNSKDTNRTRDLPAYSAVPQPTAPPRTPFHGQFWSLYLHYYALTRYVASTSEAGPVIKRA